MILMLHKLKDARERLDAYLDTLDSAHFDWGGIHCATFGADVVYAQTGHDFAEGHRGSYSTREEATEYLKGLGFDDIGDYTAFYLPEIPVSDMDYGDLCTVKGETGEIALAMCGGTHLTAMTMHGKGSLRRSRALRAFKVG